MNTITRYILGAALLMPAIAAQAVTLPSNAVLAFSSGTASGNGVISSSVFGFASAAMTAFSGIVLGTAQPTVPGIDQTWSSSYPGISGNHYTTSPVTVLDGSTLDFSGWVMKITGLGDYAFGSMQGVANYTFDGTNYTVDYGWSALANNSGQAIGTLVGITSYNVHLVGALPPSVPVPGAMWLMGSGLLCLIGCARRKAGCSLG